MLRHASVVRPTMYLTSTDIKTAFDEARPKHSFVFQSMSPPGKRRSFPSVAKNGHPALGQCGGRMDKEKNGYWTLEMKEHVKYAASCGLTTSGSCHTPERIWSRCYGT